MGDPRRLKRTYSSPKRPWEKNRIVLENNLVKDYGLTNKKEIRVAKAILDKKRRSARDVLSLRDELVDSSKKSLIGSLERYNILRTGADIDNILSLKVEDFLERRLQTIVYRKGLAKTIKQARQFVVHGYISIKGSRVKSPSYMVSLEDENFIGYYNNRKPKILDDMQAPELQRTSVKEISEETQAEN